MWWTLALAEIPKRPDPESACDGVVPLGLIGDQLVYVIYDPGGAMDGGMCLFGASTEEMRCEGGYTREALDEAWQKIAAPLAARPLAPVRASCLPQGESGPIRRLAVSPQVWLLAREGRASVLSAASSGAEGWRFKGQLLAISAAGSERRYAILHGYAIMVLPVEPPLWEQAGQAPAVCGERSQPARVQTERTQVRIRAAPSPSATPLAALEPGGTLLWTGDRSCARQTISIEGQPSEGAWLQVIIDPDGERPGIGWVHERLVSIGPPLE